MKACSRNRKLLAWLAAGCLEENKAEPLRAHLHQCPGCHDYFDGLIRTAESLRTATASPKTQPPPSLHHRVSRALRQERSAPAFRWNLVLPAIGLAVLILALVLTSPQKRALPPSFPVASSSVIAPTILNYQLAANQSLDKLDAILSEQSRHIQPSSKVYRATDFSAAAN
jgi:predicted anti-sigma-YlaC factor YlaD